MFHDTPESPKHKAARLDAAATVLFQRAFTANGRARQFRRIAWKLVYRASLLHPWATNYLRKPAPLLKRPKVPKAEREAFKALKAARKAYDARTYSYVENSHARKVESELYKAYLGAVENYCMVCGMEYTRPKWARVA